MPFIKPKNNNTDKVDWLISEQVREIEKYYAEYCEYSESEVVGKNELLYSVRNYR